MAHVLVFITENGLAKGLDLPDNIPRFIIRDIIHDIFQQPLEYDIRSVEVFYQLVDGQLLHLCVIEPDAQIRSEVQFSCQVAQHALEEGVDGLYMEVVVVVEQIAERDARTFADKCFRLSRLLADHLHVIRGVGQLLPDTVKLAEDTHLHLFCGLVGKGHSQDITV